MTIESDITITALYDEARESNIKKPRTAKIYGSATHINIKILIVGSMRPIIRHIRKDKPKKLQAVLDLIRSKKSEFSTSGEVAA